jgi:predicted membrane protein
MMRSKRKKSGNTIREHKEKKSLSSVGNMLPAVGASKRVSGGVIKIIDGTILTEKAFLKQVPFLLYLFAIAVLYIGINFYSNKKLYEIENANDDLKELWHEYITTSVDLIQYTQVSNISDILKDTGLKRSREVTRKIIVKREGAYEK